jgi:hypothetical protein
MIDREHKVSLGVVYYSSESLPVSASFWVFFWFNYEMGSKKQLFFLVFYDQGSTIHEPIPSPVLVPVPCSVFDQPMSPCADDGKLIPTIGSITTSHKTLGSLTASLFYCRASAAGKCFPRQCKGGKAAPPSQLPNFQEKGTSRFLLLPLPASMNRTRGRTGKAGHAA